MNTNIKLGLQLFAITVLSIAIAMVAREGLAWTSPSINPPGGSGTLKADGGNIGIGITTPSQKLDVDGYVKGTGMCIGASCITAWPTGGAGGSGTVNYAAKWTSSSALGNSVIYDNGTNIGIGTASPDANYRITTSGGGIKAENSSASQPAGYFSNAGGGPAITANTGGITLGGVNRTSWPTYTAGTGISIVGTTITNTGLTSESDPSTGTLNTSGNTLCRSDSSGVIQCTSAETDPSTGTLNTGGNQWCKSDSSGVIQCTYSGFPSASTAMYTLRYNGADWISNSAIQSDGTYVGIGTVPYASYALNVNQNIAINGTVVARRDGSNAYLFPWGSGYGTNSVYLGGGSVTNFVNPSGKIGAASFCDASLNNCRSMPLISASGVCMTLVSGVWAAQNTTTGGATCNGALHQLVTCPSGTTKIQTMILDNSGKGGEGAICIKL